MAERTIGKIIGACQEGAPATEEELRLTLLALYYHFGLGSFQESEIERTFHLLKATPSGYLGERWTPGTKANTEGRTLSEGILHAVEKKRSRRENRND